MSRIAVLGSNGQLGQDLLKNCPSSFETIALTRKDLDLREIDKIGPFIKRLAPDILINTAAFHKTDDCESQPERAFLVNAIAVRELAIACNKTKTKMVHISTDYVFGGQEISEPYVESSIPSPLNTYGVSKYAGELFLEKYGQRYNIVRVASLYGEAGASGKGGNFVYAILKKARAGDKIRVINDIYMSPTYTDDASKEIWNLILSDRENGVYHVVNSGYCSWYEFAKKIVEYSPYTVKVEAISHIEYPSKAQRPLWSPLTSEKGIRLRAWENAVKAFVGVVEANRSGASY
ncbi:MAG: dTDP-4-dehydrorhamnose reductase [Candidatus Ranarchaeia archaeon]